jgi:dipeptidyl aminopeptidase/acylaminoacyl peptidase
MLPSFADLVAGARSPTEGESCCSANDKTVYERARTDRRFEMLKVTYRSDDLPVVAFIYRPAAAGAKQPVVVYNRGSFIRQNAARELLVPMHRLAAAGFVVVAPMYRGSEGAPGRDEMGGADLRDGFPARAAAVVGAFTDLDQYAKEDPQVQALAPKILPDFATNRAAIIERRSAVRWADRIGAPLLIMHGGNDTSVNPAHALQLAAALQGSGKPYELVIVAGARHVLDPYEAERDGRAIRWFRRFMGEGRPQ